jgi:hypothetical protein
LKTIVGDAAFGGKINKTSNNSKIIMSLISGYVNNAIQPQYFCVGLYGVILFISYNGVGAVGANQPEKIEIFYTEQRATKTRTTHTVKTERTKWTPKSTAREPPSPRNRRMSSNW